MRSSLLYLLVVLSISIHSVQAGWQMTFSDEFNQPANSKLNTTAWNVFYEFSPTIINEELEFYSPDSFSFSGSSMSIVAQHRPLWTYQLNYTSGVITTQNKFSQAYGYFEIKTRLPKGNGFWPAFWLLPQSAKLPLEIDIFEILEQAPTLSYWTFHCDYNSKNPLNRGSFGNVSELGDGNFHTFGLQWIPGTLIWYIDGIQRWNLSNSCIPNTPEYILANLAVGGSWPVPPNNQTAFPSYMEIDYIRAYKQVGQGNGISLPGQIGQGIDFKYPNLDPPVGPFEIGLVTASPETVDGPGSSLTISVNITINNGSSYSNMKAQLGLYPYTLSPISHDAIVSSTQQGLNFVAGQSYNVRFPFVIPGGTANGYYKGSFGIFNNNWQNEAWYDTIVMVGVGRNYIVGKDTGNN